MKAGSVTDAEESKEQILTIGERNIQHYMTPAVDFLSHEPNFLFKESAKEQEERIRAKSRFGHLQTWKLARVIVKSGDDLRLEQFAM